MGFNESLKEFNENMTAIADAVRSATGSSDKMDLADIATTLPSICGSGEQFQFSINTDCNIILFTQLLADYPYLTFVTSKYSGSSSGYIVIAKNFSGGGLNVSTTNAIVETFGEPATYRITPESTDSVVAINIYYTSSGAPD